MKAETKRCREVDKWQVENSLFESLILQQGKAKSRFCRLYNLCLSARKHKPTLSYPFFLTFDFSSLYHENICYLWRFAFPGISECASFFNFYWNWVCERGFGILFSVSLSKPPYDPFARGWFSQIKPWRWTLYCPIPNIAFTSLPLSMLVPLLLYIHHIAKRKEKKLPIQQKRKRKKKCLFLSSSQSLVISLWFSYIYHCTQIKERNRKKNYWIFHWLN